MLNIVNEDLFSFSAYNGINQVTQRPYFRLTISSSNKIVRNADRGNRNYNPQNDIGDASVPQLVPVIREILKINAPDQNFNEYPMSMKVYDNESGIPCVELKTLDKTRDNRANIYLIAFPFNGMLKPLEESPLYRIYKGALLNSSKPFWFNNRRYRKVLYLVVEPNLNLFTPDHKYHKDEIPIVLESYNFFKDKDDNFKEKTIHEIFSFKITDQSGAYDFSFENEILDEVVRVETEPGTQMWTTFRFIPKENTDETRHEKPIKKSYAGKSSKQPPRVIQGGMVVTTNKHGIRKEIPLDQKNDRRKGGRDLDRMMRDSGMYDHDEPNPKDKNGNRGKRGRH